MYGKKFQTTQNTLKVLLQTTTDNDRSNRDANMNYHNMIKTLELTTYMQTELDTERNNNNNN